MESGRAQRKAEKSGRVGKMKITATSVTGERIEGNHLEQRMDGLWLIDKHATGYRETKVEETTVEVVES